MRIVEKLLKTLQAATLQEAGTILRWYGRDYDELHRKLHNGYFPTTPREILTVHNGCERLARAIQIGYFGGPPANPKYYFGSFLSFTVDRVLRAHALSEIDYTWLFKFDGRSPHNVFRQLRKHMPPELKTAASKRAKELYDVILIQGENVPVYKTGEYTYSLGETSGYA